MKFRMIFFLAACLGSVPLYSQSLFNVPQNHLTFPAGNWEINFIWQGDSVGSRWEPHNALLIPVKLANCPRLFYMQFDLGSPYSLLYSNKLDAIRRKYPKALPAQDSALLKDFSFSCGKLDLHASEIIVRSFGGKTITWNVKNIEVIGTLGADFIDNRITEINYPQKKIITTNAYPELLGQAMISYDLIYAARRVLLPAELNGKKTMLYFDTGSSAHALLTDKETSQSMAIPNSMAAVYPVRSWDRVMTANTLQTNDSISVAGKRIAIGEVTFIEGATRSQIEQMKKMGIGGMTGNKLFLNHRLILDMQRKKFGLLK